MTKKCLKAIAKFESRSGKEIKIYLPTLDRIKDLLYFVNRLTDEDTFLSFTGKHKTFDEEESWIKNAILSMKSGKSFVCWAVYGGKIIASADVNRGGTRDWHVGQIGLMVDKDFRSDGIGRYLLEYVLVEARGMKIKIARLDIFSDNKIAISLYKKLGFKEYARLPKGFYRRGKYSDEIKMYKNLSSFAKATEDK